MVIPGGGFAGGTATFAGVDGPAAALVLVSIFVKQCRKCIDRQSATHQESTRMGSQRSNIMNLVNRRSTGVKSCFTRPRAERRLTVR